MILPRRSLLAALSAFALAPLFRNAALATDEHGIDLDALGRLRPGMPVAALEAALGPRWRPIEPYRGGVVDQLATSHSFTARVDVRGRLGEVSYSEGFAAGVSVGGLRMGMSPKEAKRVLPRLRLEPKRRPNAPSQDGSAQLPGKVSLSVSFWRDKLISIEFANPDAVYPPKGAPPYPVARGEPGAPFKDPNLKLVVLAELARLKEIDLGQPGDLASHLLKRLVDFEDLMGDPEARIPEAHDYLARYPVTAEGLARVTSLTIANNAVFTYVIPSWGFLSPTSRPGAPGFFPIRTLAGIGHCPNIEELAIDDLMDVVDLGELTVLPKLAAFASSVPVRNVDALLKLPALAECRLFGDAIFEEVTTPGHPTRAVMETLKGRGVKVWVQWETMTNKLPYF
jgi:hypothetical protein